MNPVRGGITSDSRPFRALRRDGLKPRSKYMSYVYMHIYTHRGKEMRERERERESCPDIRIGSPLAATCAASAAPLMLKIVIPLLLLF